MKGGHFSLVLFSTLQNDKNEIGILSNNLGFSSHSHVAQKRETEIFEFSASDDKEKHFYFEITLKTYRAKWESVFYSKANCLDVCLFV